MAKDLAPFSCTFSPGLAEFLINQRCSLAISTYQAGKVIFISPKDRDHIIQLPRNFDKPMGIAVDGDKMAVAVRDEVVVMANNTELGTTYPKQPGVYDGLFIPRAVYFTGQLDLHDLHWTNAGLLSVNTRFSCLATMDDVYSFRPVWQPSFIDDLTPEDRCHLNGVAIDGGNAVYTTALGKSNQPSGWRPAKATGGILIDVNTKEIILEGLSMPHSPRIFDGALYLLISGTGELVQVDVKSGKYTVVRRLDGFVRGMDRCGDYIFVGLSKLRRTTKAFNDLPISERSLVCGVVAIHLPTGSVSHVLKYENSVEEIFDVKVLPEMMRPGILNHMRPEHRLALSIPGKTFWARNEDDEG